MADPDAKQLINTLQDIAEDLGHPPTRSDINNHAEVSVNAFRSVFGSWSEALETAGFDVQRSGQRISDEDLLKELNRLADKLGHTPTIQDLREHGQFSISPYKDHFGSWNEALETADLKPNTGPSNPIPRTDLIDELQRLGDNLGYPPTQSDMNEYGAYSTSTYERAFNSWMDALDKAGFDQSDLRSRKRISEKTLLNELKRLNNELGHPPTTDEMKNCGQFSVPTYRNRFGSWADALKEAGLNPQTSQSSQSLSQKDLINDLQQLADELGHPPTLQEQKNQGSHSHSVYYDHFGSWRNALQAAGFEDQKPQEAATQDELIRELQQLAKEHNQRPTTTLMNEEGKFWASTYRNHFSSWNAALKAAGFDISDKN